MTRRLAEVAKYVGVSEATVSRVLNGKPGISEATRTAVLTALDVLGYERPTKLRGERARLVGLVLPELQNPIFPAFAEVVAGALAKRGFTPVLCTRTADGVSEADYVDMLLEQQVSGVIFARRPLRAGRRRPRALPPAARARPARGAGQRRRSSDLGFPRVSTDDAARASSRRTATWPRSGTTGSALLLGPADHVPSPRKLAAFLAARERHGHEGSALIGAPSSRWRAARPPPPACSSAGVTGADLRLRRAGARRDARRPAGWACTVPGDVSVVGYDDSTFMACTDPPLTTVRQPIEAMGQAAVALLVTRSTATRAATRSCSSSRSWWCAAPPARPAVRQRSDPRCTSPRSPALPP